MQVATLIHMTALDRIDEIVEEIIQMRISGFSGQFCVYIRICRHSVEFYMGNS